MFLEGMVTGASALARGARVRVRGPAIGRGTRGVGVVELPCPVWVAFLDCSFSGETIPGGRFGMRGGVDWALRAWSFAGAFVVVVAVWVAVFMGVG